MKVFAIVLLVVVFVSPVRAEVYQWVDEQGTVNFAEDLSRVPKKYRKQVRVLGGAGSVEQETIESEMGDASGQRTGAREPAPVEQMKGAAEQKPRKALYGGKEADEWKADFARIRREIKGIEKELSERRGRLAEGTGLTRTQFLGLQAEVRSLEERLVKTRASLDALDEEATRAGVPFDLR